MTLKDRYPRLPPGVTPSDIDKTFGGSPCEHEFRHDEEPIIDPDPPYVNVWFECANRSVCEASEVHTYKVPQEVAAEVYEEALDTVEWSLQPHNVAGPTRLPSGMYIGIEYTGFDVYA